MYNRKRKQSGDGKVSVRRCRKNDRKCRSTALMTGTTSMGRGIPMSLCRNVRMGDKRVGCKADADKI
jgi:hypothetical protein